MNPDFKDVGNSVFRLLGKVNMSDFLKILFKLAVEAVAIIALSFLILKVVVIIYLLLKYLYFRYIKQLHPLYREDALAGFKESLLSIVPYRKAIKGLYTTKKSMKRGVALTTLVLACLAVAVLQESPYGSEKLGSIVQKNKYQSYSYVILHTKDNSYTAIAEMSFNFPIYEVEMLYFPNSKSSYVEDCTFTIYDYYEAHYKLKVPLYVDDYNVQRLEFLNEGPDNVSLKKYNVPGY